MYRRFVSVDGNHLLGLQVSLRVSLIQWIIIHVSTLYLILLHFTRTEGQ